MSTTEYIKNPFHQGRLRNRICVCGSGEKLKKCHGSKSHIRKDVYIYLENILEENAIREQNEGIVSDTRSCSET